MLTQVRWCCRVRTSTARYLSGSPDPRSFVNLERYPVHQLETKKGQEFVQQCQGTLDASGLLKLPGFLTPLALKSFLGEEAAGHSSQQTTHVKYAHTTEFNDDLQPGETAQHLEETEQWVMGYDQLEQNSALKALYHWDPVLHFVRAVLGRQVYLSQDPMNRLHLNR